MGNACGCPPTMELVHRGVLTGLGTDGYTHDMLESYKVANVLHKHHLCDANAAWSEVPLMLFENNRKIASRQFDRPLGILKEGAAADVIVSPPVLVESIIHIFVTQSGRQAETMESPVPLCKSGQRFLSGFRQARRYVFTNGLVKHTVVKTRMSV